MNKWLWGFFGPRTHRISAALWLSFRFTSCRVISFSMQQNCTTARLDPPISDQIRPDRIFCRSVPSVIKSTAPKQPGKYRSTNSLTTSSTANRLRQATTNAIQDNVANINQTCICTDSPTSKLIDSQRSRRSCNYIHFSTQTCMFWPKPVTTQLYSKHTSLVQSQEAARLLIESAYATKIAMPEKCHQPPSGSVAV